jgi:hypothetical protein
MPPGSSSGASSLDRPRCGGSGWRCCRQPPNGWYKDVNEAWAELVAMMVTDGGLPREEAERLASEWLQATGTSP